MSEKILSKSGKRSYTPAQYKKMQARGKKISAKKSTNRKKKTTSSPKMSEGKILSKSGKRSYTPTQYKKMNARLLKARKQIKLSPHARMEHARKFRGKKSK